MGSQHLRKRLIEESDVRWMVLSRDDIRAELMGENYYTWYNHKDAEDIVSKIFDLKLKYYIQNKENIIVDNTMIKVKYLKAFIDRVNQLSKSQDEISFELIQLNTPLKECLKRNEARERTVPKSVVERFYDVMIKENVKMQEYWSCSVHNALN